MNEGKRQMITEMRNENSEGLHLFSTMEIIELMNREDKTVAYAVEKALPQIKAAIDAAVTRLENGGRLYYIGAGTSGRLGVLDASECPPTFGVPAELVNGIIAGGEMAVRIPVENAEDNSEEGRMIVKELLVKEDVLVGIASSGRTPYVLGALEQANTIGCQTIGLACNLQTELSKTADIMIEIPVGPEIITGSTRLKAGTAQKMVLNMISTAVMIKLGKVYGNLMVNVQATNDKLRMRSVSIIQDITGAEEALAKKMNEEAKGNTRAAILMILYKLSYEQACSELRKHDDHFPRAMKALENRRV
ncbi:N-acetylmuramic acid-6-phosphate etherase [Bacillus sp. FJAT-27916]|uniref:N-acetylmuramic acid 6-phosphate etherase n=1 Tax=Bacillus sp. FJAT-27916 TaxID=1679169 RepID=UPI000670D0A4|nr:N-acetylmuramic acid 6-phosphate etherase [Bacillus sp. FJAT-27916]KMY45434.1 N-acetylmuramic acid-6-phosphate etherase [Bacillus sp. FJAT-27916]